MALIDGFEKISPGDSYSHSPQGADCRGPMKTWRDKTSEETTTDTQKTSHGETRGSGKTY